MATHVTARNLICVIVASAHAAFTAAVLSAAAKPPAPVKIFIFAKPSPSGFIDQESKNRDESAKDVRYWVGRNKDWFRIVEAPSSADVTLEVLGRTSRTRPDDGILALLRPTPGRIARRLEIVHEGVNTLLRANGQEKEITGWTSSESAFFGWNNAANNVSTLVEKWATDNYARLVPVTSTVPAPGPSAASPVARPPKAPVARLKVYCFASLSSAAAPDAGSTDRADALQDLKEEIVKRGDWLELATSQATSDVAVEVLDRWVVSWWSHRSEDEPARKKDGTTTGRPVITDYHLKTVLRLGEYAGEIEAVVSPEDLAPWRAAARQVARSIEQWAKDNEQIRTRGRP